MRSLRDHERIVEAITERDEQLAEFLMRRHIVAARERFQESTRSNGSSVDEIELAGFSWAQESTS
jgi:DNA-binding GntR family transcriptional regulator